MSKNRVYILMVLAAIFWSGAFITGKIAVREFSALSLTFFRFLFALPLIFLILRIREPEKWKPQKTQWVPLITLGIIGTFLYHALFFSSLKYTTAINSSLIGAMNPMVTTFLAILFFREKVTPLRILGILLSFIGVFLIVTNGDLQILTTLRFNYGDILMFIAVWCWATYAVISRRYMQKYQLTPLMTTAYTFLVCTIVALPLFLWEKPFNIINISLAGWLSILYMAIFASVLGYMFQLLAIQYIGAAKASIFINLVPIFTITQSLLILHEPFSVFKFISGGIILIGVYLASRPDKEVQ
jgi:drug/metabolite transporter (DMT)-like permease